LTVGDGGIDVTAGALAGTPADPLVTPTEVTAGGAAAAEVDPVVPVEVLPLVEPGAVGEPVGLDPVDPVDPGDPVVLAGSPELAEPLGSPVQSGAEGSRPGPSRARSDVEVPDDLFR
jgi:hypothetical protein